MNKKLTNKNFLDEDFWRKENHINKSNKFRIIWNKFASQRNRHFRLLDIYIPNQKIKKLEALEIGCYPSGFLIKVSEKGYIVNGIDYTEYLSEMIKSFEKSGIKVGEIINEDFLSTNLQKNMTL